MVTKTTAAGRERGKHYPRKVFSLCRYLWREPWAGCSGMALRATGHTPPLETGTKEKKRHLGQKYQSQTIPDPHNGIPNAGRCHCRNTRGQPASVTGQGAAPSPASPHGSLPKTIAPGYSELPNKLQQLPSHPQLAVHKGQGIYWKN